MNLLCLRSDTTKTLPEFAKYLIRSQGFRSRLSNSIKKAVNQASVSIGDLKAIHVSVPALSAQLRIAAVLDKADALRAKRRAALALLNTVAQSVFLDMFGDPNENPRRWSIRPVSEFVSEFRGGKSIESESDDSTATRNRVLKVGAATSMRFIAEESKPVSNDYDPPAEHLGMSLRLLKFSGGSVDDYAICRSS